MDDGRRDTKERGGPMPRPRPWRRDGGTTVETALATETGNTERTPVNAVGEQAELFFDRGMAGTANPGFPAANPCLGRRVEQHIEATSGTRESCSQGLG